MAYSEFLVDRVRQRLSGVADVEEKKMMGGLIFMVRGKMCTGIDIDKKSGEDRLMVRIGKNVYQAALMKKGCRAMDFTGKAMKGFVFVYPEGFDQDNDLDFWIQKALAFNTDPKKSK